MFNRKNIFVFILIVFVIFTGIIYAQQEEVPQNKDEQFEITEKSSQEEGMKTESEVSSELLTEESSEQENTEQSKSLNSDQDALNDPADKTAKIIGFEELFQFHPETKSLYKEYQAKKEKIKKSDSPEKDMAALKKSYLPLVVENTKDDLKEFAEAKEIDTLIINEKIVIGEDKYYPDKLTDIENMTAEFKSYLNK